MGTFGVWRLAFAGTDPGLQGKRIGVSACGRLQRVISLVETLPFRKAVLITP